MHLGLVRLVTIDVARTFAIYCYNHKQPIIEASMYNTPQCTSSYWLGGLVTQHSVGYQPMLACLTSLSWPLEAGYQPALARGKVFYFG